MFESPTTSTRNSITNVGAAPRACPKGCKAFRSPTNGRIIYPINRYNYWIGIFEWNHWIGIFESSMCEWLGIGLPAVAIVGLWPLGGHEAPPLQVAIVGLWPLGGHEAPPLRGAIVGPRKRGVVYTGNMGGRSTLPFHLNRKDKLSPWIFSNHSYYINSEE